MPWWLCLRIYGCAQERYAATLGKHDNSVLVLTMFYWVWVNLIWWLSLQYYKIQWFFFMHTNRLHWKKVLDGRIGKIFMDSKCWNLNTMWYSPQKRGCTSSLSCHVTCCPYLEDFVWELTYLYKMLLVTTSIYECVSHGLKRMLPYRQCNITLFHSILVIYLEARIVDILSIQNNLDQWRSWLVSLTL